RLPVDAEDGAKGAELEPAGEQLLGRRSEVAADVGGPVRHAGDRVAQAGRDLRRVDVLGRVDVPRPGRRRVALQARVPAAGEDVDALVVRADLAPTFVHRLVVLQRVSVDVERALTKGRVRRVHVDALGVALRLGVVGPDRIPTVLPDQPIVRLLIDQRA